MDAEDFEGLKRAMKQVQTYMAGERSGFVTHARSDTTDFPAGGDTGGEASAMTWNYRLIQHTDHIGLHEVFYDDAGEIRNWTTDAVTFIADNEEGPEGIIGSLEMALADARKYPLLIAGELPQ